MLLGQRYIVIGGGIDGLQILGVDLVDGWFDSNAAGAEDLLLRRYMYGDPAPRSKRREAKRSEK